MREWASGCRERTAGRTDDRSRSANGPRPAGIARHSCGSGIDRAGDSRPRHHRPLRHLWAWALERPARLKSEEHTSELQSRPHLVCRLLLEKKKVIIIAFNQ